MRQMIVQLGDLLQGLRDKVVAFIGIELQDASHLDLHQLENILAGHLPHQLRLERLQAAVDVRHRLIHIRRILKLPIFIDSLLNEDLLQRGEEECLLLLLLLDL